MKSFYELQSTTIRGEPLEFSSLKGRKVMIVNTASECGLTPQYTLLEELYQQHKATGFVIIGFPANNFGGQEPGSNQDILRFCEINYHVSFPMMQKISVIGDDQDPVYRWLTTKAENGASDVEMKWNFQKFLVSESGNWVASIAPDESPVCDQILDWLESN